MATGGTAPRSTAGGATSAGPTAGRAGSPIGSPIGAPTPAERIARRELVARRLARRYGGVVLRGDLLEAGLTRHDVDVQVRRGAWSKVGVHTICIDGRVPSGRGLLWWALWESGPRSVLDGASALIAAGLTSWEEPLVHVSVPGNSTVRDVPGVKRHTLRDLGPCITGGLRRTKPEVALVRAAEWARSDRAAATIVAMAVQQQLVSPPLLLARWESVGRSRRRATLDGVIRDVCAGSESINELDVLTALRARGLPLPSRQVVRSGPDGRVYLDMFWDEEGLHVEIQGAHHYVGLAVVGDALRLNSLSVASAEMISLQIPVIGWRLDPEPFLAQIAEGLAEGRRRRQGTAG